jgi:hypothetical protein
MAAEAKSDWNFTDTYCTVPLGAARYRCPHLTAYRAVPVYQPRRAPYRSVRNMAAEAESDWNCTDTYCAVPLGAAWYRCTRLATHRSDLYGIGSGMEELWVAARLNGKPGAGKAQ